MIPSFEHHPNSRFLGFPMSQNRYAIPAWSYLLEKVVPSTIVEIGTSEGGMSCLLALVALRTGAMFNTVDIENCMNKETRKILDILCEPPAGFCQYDAFGETCRALLLDRLARPGVALILCDGGNKGREFSEFAPMLKVGDIIAAHDARGRESWPWQEFQPNLFRDFMIEHCLEEFMPEIFLETGWFVCRKIAKSQ